MDADGDRRPAPRGRGARAPSSPRVLILAAGVGEGHNAAARALALELTAADPHVEVVIRDGLAGLGALLSWAIRGGYRAQLRWLPAGYGLLYGFFTRLPPARGLGRAGLAALASRPLLKLIRAHKPDIVVSTYPGVTVVLGHLRRRGHLDVPTCATITDLNAHAFWADRGVDLHLVMYEESIAAVERVAGKDSARRVRPLVAPSFRRASSRVEARRALGLPEEGPVILVSGGGWGVGDLEGAARSLLAHPTATVVCVCGHNERARRRLQALWAENPRALALGFTARMRELLAAADAVVHSTGGVTCLEALVCGRPIIAHRPPPGHMRANAEAMAQFGLADLTLSPPALRDAVKRVLTGARAAQARLPAAPTAASLVMSARRRVNPLPGWRRIAPRAAAVVGATILSVGWTFSSDEPFPLVARTLDLSPLSSMSVSQPKVALVIRAPAVSISSIGTELHDRGTNASFAVVGPVRPSTMRAVQEFGDELLPELGAAGLTDWLDTRDRLRRIAASLGLTGHFYYLVPNDGLSLGQYVFARAIGAFPVAPALEVGSEPNGAPVRSGQVVAMTVGADPRSATRAVDRLLTALGRQGLSAVSMSELASSAAAGKS